MRVPRAEAEEAASPVEPKKKAAATSWAAADRRRKRNQERLDVFFVTPAFATVAFGATCCFADSTNDAVQTL